MHFYTSILGLTSSDDDYIPPDPDEAVQFQAKLNQEDSSNEKVGSIYSFIAVITKYAGHVQQISADIWQRAYTLPDI